MKDEQKPAIVKPEDDGTVTELSEAKPLREKSDGRKSRVRTIQGRALKGEGFPDVDSQGVTMSAKEREAAQRAADANGVRLIVD